MSAVNASSDTLEPSPLDWSADDLFAHAAQVLLARVENAAIERLDANLLLLHSDRRVFVLLRYARQLEPQLVKIVAHLVAEPSPGRTLELAVIGGDTRVRGLVEQSKPRCDLRHRLGQ